MEWLYSSDSRMFMVAFDNITDVPIEDNQKFMNNLEDKLSKFAVNNTVIITICNLGMAGEWLQQWYMSARLIGIANIIVVVTNEEAYAWVSERIGERAILFTDIAPLLDDEKRWEYRNKNEVERAFNWRSAGYEKIVVQRATVLKYLLLSTNLDFIYSDTDIHWLKDPTQYLSQNYAEFDMCIQREQGDELGDYNCSGFLYLRNTRLTLLLVKTWESYIKRRMRKRGFFTDQEELNFLFKDIQIRSPRSPLPKDLKQVKLITLDWDEFPSGINYFSMRKKGKGKISKTCQSKMCKKLVWIPRKQLAGHKFNQRNFIIHHNHAKSNQLKIQRAKDANIWLNLSSDDWM